MDPDMEHDTQRETQRNIGSTESRPVTLRGLPDFNAMDRTGPSSPDPVGQWSASSRTITAPDEKTTSDPTYANPGRPEVASVGSGVDCSSDTDEEEQPPESSTVTLRDDGPRRFRYIQLILGIHSLRQVAMAPSLS